MYLMPMHPRFSRTAKIVLVLMLLWTLLLNPAQSALADNFNAGIDTSNAIQQLYSGDPNATVAPVQPTPSRNDSTVDLNGVNWEGINTSQQIQDLYDTSAPTPSENYNNTLKTIQQQQDENNKAFTGDFKKDSSPNIVERLFGTFVSQLPGAVLGMLGLKDIGKLIYGFSGFTSAGASTDPVMVWNLFSSDDYNSIIVPIYNGLKDVAWSIGLVMLYLACFKMARSGANSQRRKNAYEMLEDWIIGTIFVGASIVLISILFNVLNISLHALAPSNPPDFLGTARSGNNPITNTGNFVTDMIVAPFYVLALAGIEVALNFIYLQRYFVLIVLIGASPVFCALYFNEKTRPSFVYYWKELLGNIFQPIFHAFFLLVYSLIAAHTSVGIIPQLMFLIMMIPVSNMMRGILGLAGTGKGLGENLMMGVGLGATMGMMRSFGNLGAVLAGGGSDVGEAAAAGAMMGGGSGSRMYAGDGGGDSRSLGQVTGGEYMGKMASRVSTMRRAGNALGQVYGSIGGAVFGAATGGGNMTMMMSAMAGNRVGGSMGSTMGGTAAAAPIAIKSMGSSERTNSFNEALGGSSPLADGLSTESKINLGKANATSLMSQGMRGTPFVGQAMEKRANRTASMAAASVMGEIDNNTNTPWESGDMVEKVSTNAGSAVYQRKLTGASSSGQPQYGERRLMDFGQQGHSAGSDSIPIVEQANYNGDVTRTFKPNDIYTNVGRNDPRGPRGSAILNDLARKR